MKINETETTNTETEDHLSSCCVKSISNKTQLPASSTFWGTIYRNPKFKLLNAKEILFEKEKNKQ